MCMCNESNILHLQCKTFQRFRSHCHDCVLCPADSNLLEWVDMGEHQGAGNTKHSYYQQLGQSVPHFETLSVCLLPDREVSRTTHLIPPPPLIPLPILLYTYSAHITISLLSASLTIVSHWIHTITASISSQPHSRTVLMIRYTYHHSDQESTKPQPSIRQNSTLQSMKQWLDHKSVGRHQARGKQHQ